MNDLYLRLEPRTRADDLTPGLVAAVHDPAWLLSRQWVMGEFDGEDAGTPVQVRATLRVHPISTLEVGTGAPVNLVPGGPPLDLLVEREPTWAATDWTLRRRIDAGRELLHQLREAGLPALALEVLRQYPLARLDDEAARLDPAAAALARVSAGRLPDGQACFEEAAGPAGTLARLTVPASEANRFRVALASWRRWLASVHTEPSPGQDAWDGSRFEHRARLLATGWPHALVAAGDRGGQLSWASFDVTDAPAGPSPASLQINAVPTPVRFRGMPPARLFEMEDAGIDLGAVDAAAADLARMALLEFALVYANDMFMVPLRVQLGSVVEIASLEVEDNFGSITTLRSATRAPAPGRAGWSFMAPATADGGRLPALVLPPVAGHPLVGPVTDEVRLMRDEMANLVWAVEHKFEGGDGRARPSAETASPPSALSPPSATDALDYRLMTAVQPHWFPMLLEAGDPRRLRLALVEPAAPSPRSRLLPPPGGLVHEEEVTREGLRLVRERVLARSSDGRTWLWTRRRRFVGRGEGASGLAFDQALPPPV